MSYWRRKKKLNHLTSVPLLPTAGRVTKITDPSGNWSSYSYDSAGRRIGVTYTNGTSTAYTYDTTGRLLGMTTNGPSGVISSYQYTYDKMGNRLSVNEAGNNSTMYTYDKLYRLTAYDETRPGAEKASFTYDTVGNRTNMLLAKKYLPNDSRSFTYTYDQGNQLLNVMQKGRQSPVETVFGYDKNGSLVSQAVSQGKTTATTSYLYDYHNQLSKVSTPDGKTVTIDNLTDGFSRLAKSTSTGTTRYLHDGMSVLAEYDAAGSETARYTLGPGTDEIIARKDTTGTYFYHYDGLGSVTAITDSTGKVVAKYDYEPFGRQKETTVSTRDNPYTFTGREWDKETGLYYYRARYYDPMEGRFISKDPISTLSVNNFDVSEEQRLKSILNPYSYTDNNPINYTDPTGLASWHFDRSSLGERLIHYGKYRFNRLGQLVEHSGKVIGEASCDAKKALDWLMKVKPDFFRAVPFLLLLPGQEQGLNNFSRTGSFTTSPDDVY